MRLACKMGSHRWVLRTWVHWEPNTYEGIYPEGKTTELGRWHECEFCRKRRP